MKKELQDKLYENYPKIFRQKDLSMHETCMNWGICTGDGWYTLIDALCCSLQFNIDYNKQPQLEAVQVKEKFGGLRFYVENASSEQHAVISFVEAFSTKVCETCGSTENVTQTPGWIMTICSKCLAEYDESMKRKNQSETNI